MAKGDTMKKVMGGVEIAAGVATGNPILAIQGAGTMAGGFAGNGKQGGGGPAKPASIAPEVPSPDTGAWGPIDDTRSNAAQEKWLGNGIE